MTLGRLPTFSANFRDATLVMPEGLGFKPLYARPGFNLLHPNAPENFFALQPKKEAVNSRSAVSVQHVPSTGLRTGLFPMPPRDSVETSLLVGIRDKIYITQKNAKMATGDCGGLRRRAQ